MHRTRATLGLLIAGCGRVGFDATADAPGTELGGLTKLSVNAPLLDSPASTSPDCGAFLVFRAADDSRANDDLMPFAAVDDTTATIWFAYSCKSSDVGWSETIGSWTPPDGLFQRYDGDPGALGTNEFVSNTATMPDGMIATSLRQLRFAFGGDGKVYGIGSRTRPDAQTQEAVPVRMDRPLDLATSSYDLAHAGVFDPPAAPWSVVTGPGRDILRDGSTFYLYSVHWDGSAQAPTGVPLTSIAVATTTDMISATFPATPLVTGWTDPSVSAWGGSYHMVARDLSTNSYSYIHGTAPDQFDFAHAVPLGLAAHAGAPGAWDHVNYIEHGLSGDPRVSSARVVDGTLYIFYIAGVPPNPSAAARGVDSKRGLGVFALPLAVSG